MKTGLSLRRRALLHQGRIALGCALGAQGGARRLLLRLTAPQRTLVLFVRRRQRAYVLLGARVKWSLEVLLHIKQ